MEVDLQTELTELRGLSVLLADTIPTSIWNDGDHTSSGKEKEGSASTYLAIRPQASEFAQALRSLHRPHTPCRGYAHQSRLQLPHVCSEVPD